MEASPGTDIRNNWNLLAYSMVTYWYGMPDATSNHGPKSELARRKIFSLSEIDRIQELLKDGIISFNPGKLEKLVKDSVYNCNFNRAIVGNGRQ